MKDSSLDKELVEKLADIEHERWADWQRWVHQCGGMIEVEGVMLFAIPADVKQRWDRQIRTPYKDLTEKEKQSDRDQVNRYLPLIQELITEARKDELEHLGIERNAVMCSCNPHIMYRRMKAPISIEERIKELNTSEGGE
jgi:hypothetical protein